MSKTLKDKANHFAHHLKSETDGLDHQPRMQVAIKSKNKYTKEDIPKDVKELVELNLDYRYGHQRKMRAKMKVDERKIQRAKNKVDLLNNLKEKE